MQVKMKALVEQLKQWDHAYYVKDAPLVPDAVYDSIFKELLSLEKEYPQLIDSTSPTQRVSGGISKGFKVVKHDYPMLSIKTETKPSREALKQWIESLQQPDEPLVMEYKYDGLGLSLKYDKGIFVEALTRGDCEKGEDVLANAQYIHGIPKNIPTHEGIVVIRGEVLMYKKDFQALNIKQASAGLSEFANTRNAAAGTLRTLDSSVTASRHLRFIPYSAKWTHNGVNLFKDQWYGQTEVLQVLTGWGFIKPHYEDFGDIKESILDYDLTADDYYNAFEHVGKIRDQIPFEIDGVVFKVNNISAQSKLGFRSREPVWAIAYKFEAEQATTELLGIDVQVGRTGKLTPVARLNPVFVGGTTVTNVTLHNRFDLRNRGVRVGDTVIVRRAGDVIPEIVGPIKSLRAGYLPNFKIETCPECHSKAVRSKGTREYRCISGICTAQTKRVIEHYASRLAMNIDGLGESTIDLLYDKGIIKTLVDIYNFSAETFKCAGLGDKSASNLVNAIEASKDTTFAKFVYALGIPDVGEGTSIRLAERYTDVEVLANATVEELKQVRDIGQITANSIHTYFKHADNRSIALWLQNKCLRIKSVVAGDELAGKVFAITGSFENFDRDTLRQRIHQLGGIVSGSVGKKTNYLITGKEPGATKLTAAKANGVREISWIGNIDIEYAVNLLKELN